MADRRTEIIRNLKKEGEKTVAYFKGFSPDELEVTVYTEEVQWTVRQVLAHFITIERSMQWLFNNILAGGPGAPEDFDIQRFNRTQPAKLDGIAMDELIRQFEIVRKDTVEIVENMQEADLDRAGRHAFFGDGNLDRFIRWAYEHAHLHQNDIHSVLRNKGLSQK